MRKYLILLLLIFPTFIYSQDSQVKFKVKANHYYEFKIQFKSNTQYLFKLEGNSVFNFKIIEPSGNEWELQRSYFTDKNLWTVDIRENILDKGEYVIRIYSISDNYIIMTWGEY